MSPIKVIDNLLNRTAYMVDILVNMRNNTSMRLSQVVITVPLSTVIVIICNRFYSLSLAIQLIVYRISSRLIRSLVGHFGSELIAFFKLMLPYTSYCRTTNASECSIFNNSPISIVCKFFKRI